MARHSLGGVPSGVDPFEYAASGILSEIEDVLVEDGVSILVLMQRVREFAFYGEVPGGALRRDMITLTDRVKAIDWLVSHAHD